MTQKLQDGLQVFTFHPRELEPYNQATGDEASSVAMRSLSLHQSETPKVLGHDISSLLWISEATQGSRHFVTPVCGSNVRHKSPNAHSICRQGHPRGEGRHAERRVLRGVQGAI